MEHLGPRVGHWPPPPRLRIAGAFIRRTDWSGADMTGADLRNVDARNATFVGVNFKEADLSGANLSGADLTGAKNLTAEQLSSASIDETTRLPDYLHGARVERRSDLLPAAE